MDRLKIQGGIPLSGKVRISGAKNSVLPILFASIMADDESSLSNVPHLRDVTTSLELLATIGVRVTLNENKNLELNPKGIHAYEAPYELVKTMRASILVLGPLLARFGQARVSLPGGCAIGPRPVDIHLAGLKQMGAEIKVEQGYVIAKASRLRGADIFMDKVTVTGTENLLMAATLAEGVTQLFNAAQEPEIVDLANYLNAMGAKITGAGTSRIRIEGVDRLKGVSHRVIPDRIEAGTFMVAAAVTKGHIVLEDVEPEHLTAVMAKLNLMGVKIRRLSNTTLEVDARQAKFKSVNVETEPYPGFPTDMQAQLMVLNVLSEGAAYMKEAIFENRFMHVPELQRMGADIEIDGFMALVRGVQRLSGARVMATDLRASASLILAGLAADGETLIDRIYHIDRGYERIEEKLHLLGAQIQRVTQA